MYCTTLTYKCSDWNYLSTKDITHDQFSYIEVARGYQIPFLLWLPFCFGSNSSITLITHLGEHRVWRYNWKRYTNIKHVYINIICNKYISNETFYSLQKIYLWTHTFLKRILFWTFFWICHEIFFFYFWKCIPLLAQFFPQLH